MPVRVKSPDAFREYVRKTIDAKMQAVVEMFEYIGGECLVEMRERRRYIDRTGNLRSSTGFAVVVNKQVVSRSGFETVSGPDGSGAKGSAAGSACLTAAVTKAPDNAICLVLVAGMDYAIYVEHMGLNVTDSAVALAREEVNSLMKEVGLKKA